MTASPVKEAAVVAGLEVRQERARDPALAARLEELHPDVAIVVAYGSILPAALLDIPARGFVNVHFSLLPSYRGAAPVQRAIMNGDRVTGVSIMVLTEGMDEGPVLGRREVAIEPQDNAAQLGDRLAEVGADLLVPTVHDYVAGKIEPEAQDPEKATYAPKITTEDARIDWNRTRAEINNLVRALNPEPGAWSTLNDPRFKVYKVDDVDLGEDLRPSEISSAGGLFVGAKDGALSLEEIQPAGKRRMTGAEFARGARLSGSERMGEPA